MAAQPWKGTALLDARRAALRAVAIGLADPIDLLPRPRGIGDVWKPARSGNQSNRTRAPDRPRVRPDRVTGDKGDSGKTIRVCLRRGTRR